MEAERIAHSIYERRYSGFGYIKENEDIGYYYNAVLEATIAKREEFMIKGMKVSPILRKKYCFNDISKIGDIVDDFKATMRRYIDRNFMRLVEIIYEMNNVTSESMEEEFEACDEDNLKGRTLKYYKAVWQVL